MILYNVTCNVEQDIAEEWLHWMKTVHIPEVMQSGCFVDVKMHKILTNQPDDIGVNISVQYHAENMDAYEKYKQEFAPALQKKTAEKYGEKVLAFRTLLESISL